MRDSGLVHALLRIRDKEELLGHPIAGASWEGFIIENILSTMPAGTNAYFYRTSAERFVVYPGQHRFRINSATEAISLADLVKTGFA